MKIPAVDEVFSSPAWVLLALAGVLLAGAVAHAQEAPTPDGTNGGFLFLTAESLTPKSDDTCPNQPRYEMTVNRSRVEDGAARAGSLSNPIKTCPTQFLYPVTTTFRLETARIVLNLRCDIEQDTVPPFPSLEVILTNDPNFNALTTDSNTGTLVEAPSACTSDGVQVAADLAIPAMDLAPGSTLSLVIMADYVTGPEGGPLNLWFVAGGEDPSRIEASGIPSAAQEAEANFVPRPRLLWTTDPTGRARATDCSGADLPNGPVRPIYAMVPEATVVPDGAVSASVSAPGVGCFTYFDYTAVESFVLSGPLSVQFWFRCEVASVGSPNDFLVRVRHWNGEPSTASETEWTLIAPETRTGGISGLALCPEAAVEAPLAETILSDPVQFEVGQLLRIEIEPFYVNAPDALSGQGVRQVQFLVGGNTPSGVAVAGLPWNASAPDAPDSVATGPTGTNRPDVAANAPPGRPREGNALGMTLVMALALYAARRRKAV